MMSSELHRNSHQGDSPQRGQLLDEVVLNRIARGRTAGSDPQLVEDGRDMRADRRQTHHQLLGDLGIGQAFG